MKKVLTAASAMIILGIATSANACQDSMAPMGYRLGWWLGRWLGWPELQHIGQRLGPRLWLLSRLLGLPLLWLWPVLWWLSVLWIRSRLLGRALCISSGGTWCLNSGKQINSYLIIALQAAHAACKVRFSLYHPISSARVTPEFPAGMWE